MSHFSIPKLTPHNYSKWSMILSCYLTEEDVDYTEYDLGHKINSKGLRILRSSVSDEIKPTIQNLKTVKETWDFLSMKYGTFPKEIRFRKLLLLFTSRKGRNESIKSYINRMKSLCNEVNVSKEEGFKPLVEELLVCAIVKGLPEKLREIVLKWNIEDLSIQKLELKLEIEVYNLIIIGATTESGIEAF